MKNSFFAAVAGGDSNQITRAYLDSILIEMRHLDGVKPSTYVKLFGETFSTPVMTAAFSHLNPFRANGMVEIAKGAKAQNALNWAGMGDERELEDIIATGAKTVKIIKPYADRERVFKKIAHAESAGALAVGIDIDHAFGHNGDYDCVLGEHMSPVSSRELSEFASATKLPFVVKGVLSAADAVKCANAGARGIIVSHHHGIIPYAAPPLMVLPEIVSAVGSALDVFVDCGIATGADAFKALALGAKAVCVGRAILNALRDKGADGASEYIAHMTEELKAIMARTNSPTTASIPSDILR